MILIGNEYAPRVVEIINSAQTNIDIMMYQWNYYSYLSNTPIQDLSLAVKYAINRGVNVRALIHAGSPSDHLLRVNAQMSANLTKWGANVKFYKKGGVLHSKIVVVDKRLAVIGSHNYSKRSMTSNVEISALVESGEDIRRILEYFEILWGQS